MSSSTFFFLLGLPIYNQISYLSLIGKKFWSVNF